LLYCRAFEEEEQPQSLSGSLPPNPRTLKRFVGRLETFDRLFDWLFSTDEPRVFLWGKGGSGKTSIAYEFARVIQRYGTSLRLYGAGAFDNVLFLSAKEKSLDPIKGEQQAIRDPDFSDEKSLYAKILTYGGWTTDQQSVANMDLKDARKSIEEYFDLTSNLIVLDDIDTLTTKAVESGSDYLYRVLSRARCISKIVYTLRSVPLQSISNSIEVPGLKKGSEYEEFVDQCATQYGVPSPDQKFIQTLDVISERRPLVVESIIALKRTSGTYENALKLFEGDTGDDIREYVFGREWTALADGTNSRSLLAALALLDEPVTFADLTAILSIAEPRLRDAISNTKEMFLVVSEAGNETTYSV
jgi:hypothetical protein